MKLLIIIFFSLLGLSAFTQQNKGYYNSKWFLSFETLHTTPFFFNAYGRDYASMYDKNLRPTLEKYNYGYRFAAGFIVKRNLAFAVEWGTDYGDIYVKKWGYIHLNINNIENEYYYHHDVSSIKTQSFTILPKIELATKNALLPMGLTHQIGIGLSKTRLMEDKYRANIHCEDYNCDTVPEISEQFFFEHLYDRKNQPDIQHLIFMYAISMRTSVSKKIMLNYGFRYTLNVPFLNSASNVRSVTIHEDGHEYIYSPSEIKEFVNRERIFNLLNFSLGFTYVL